MCTFVAVFFKDTQIFCSFLLCTQVARKTRWFKYLRNEDIWWIILGGIHDTLYMFRGMYGILINMGYT